MSQKIAFLSVLQVCELRRNRRWDVKYVVCLRVNVKCINIPYIMIIHVKSMLNGDNIENTSFSCAIYYCVTTLAHFNLLE